MRQLFISHFLPHHLSHNPPFSSGAQQPYPHEMALHPRQAPGGMSPAIVYGIVGAVAGLLVLVLAACLINRQRNIRRRARQRLNNARQWELTNLRPLQRNTPDNTSIRSRQQLSTPHSNPSLYRDRPLPPVPIRTRSRPPNHTPSVASTRIPPSVAAILDQGTTSEGSALDIEPARPVVNETYARLRAQQDARFARLGYSKSEAMLASDTGVPSDEGVEVEVERGRQREVEGTRERVVQNAARKVASTSRAKSAGAGETPGMRVGGGVESREESEGPSAPGRERARTRTRSRGELPQTAGGQKAHLSPPRRRFVTRPSEALAHSPARSKSRARLDARFPDTNPYVPALDRDVPAWKLEPPTPTHASASASNATLKPSTYDDVPIEESVDSSRFSQLDLGTSTEDGTYVSTDISDDPWREEVRANQRRWR